MYNGWWSVVGIPIRIRDRSNVIKILLTFRVFVGRWPIADDVQNPPYTQYAEGSYLMTGDVVEKLFHGTFQSMLNTNEGEPENSLLTGNREVRSSGKHNDSFTTFGLQGPSRDTIRSRSRTARCLKANRFRRSSNCATTFRKSIWST